MSLERRSHPGVDDVLDVLLVADDTQTRDLLTASLGNVYDAVTVRPVASAAAALTVLEEGDDVDCIVSAHAASDTDGLAFLEAVRQHDSDIPFIMFIDGGDEHHVTTAFDSGVTDYVQQGGDGTTSYALLAKRVEAAVDSTRREDVSVRVQEVLDTVRTAISIVDGDGYYSYVNERYAEMYGYDPDELVGDHWTVHRVETDDEREYSEILQSVSEENWWSGELRQQTRDGRTFRTACVMWDADPDSVVVVARDISDEDEVRRVLFEERRRFDLLIEAIDNYGIVGLDTDGQITSWNTSSERINGYSRDEILDTHISILYTDQDIAAGLPEEHLRRAREEGPVHETGWRVEKSGERYWVDFTLSAVTDYAGELRGFVCVLHDRSEQAKHERQLQRRVEQLGQFASVLSHDLRNPLNTVSLSLDLARGDPDDATTHIERAERAVDRIEKLVDSLLMLAKEGEIVREFEAVSLLDPVERAWSVVNAPGAKLVVDDDDADTVQGDPERLRTMFENLFRNAVEHASPTVTIRFGTANGGFFVEDDGPGIPPKERECIFEYGYSTEEDGTGFGLSIVESISVAHGWNVTATESESGGARFEFSSILESQQKPA